MATKTKKETKVISKPKARTVSRTSAAEVKPSGVHHRKKHIRMPYLGIALLGVIVLGSLLYWRHNYLVSTEYVEFPQPGLQLKEFGEMRSKNYQLDTQDVSPSVK